MKRTSLLIIGAGPTGLGAAWRAHELGRGDWQLLEAADHAGGLAASFTDAKGFTWDIGGHVQFSHYEYFDQVMDRLLGRDGWLEHDRESWVWIRERFVPYPFQNNIHRLQEEDYRRCLDGLASAAAQPRAAKPANFAEWILATAGGGIADLFLFPYNFKVWAYPPQRLSATWVGERVAVPDLERIRRNKELDRDDVSWGPNNRFRFPVRGGTGAIWRACAAALPSERLHFGATVSGIDLAQRQVTTTAGEVFAYDALLCTLPLRELIRLSGQQQLAPAAERGLVHSSSNILGIGLRGTPPPALRTKCWMYFPEANCPFYRVTVFSNYSPNNVPDSTRTWSLMAEVSESPEKPVNQATLEQEVVAGLLATRLIGDAADIVSLWRYRAGYGYPTPALERDAALAEIVPRFESHAVYPRGRFGLWKYEVSNQDHSFMQGVEAVERLWCGRSEITGPTPHIANARKHPWPFAEWQAAGAALQAGGGPPLDGRG